MSAPSSCRLVTGRHEPIYAKASILHKKPLETLLIITY